MRVLFHDIDAARSITKNLARETGISLSKCHEALARASGFKDWHELSRTRAGEGVNLESLSIGQLAALVAVISKDLGINAGDVQHALSTSPAIPRSRFGVADHLKLRAEVFRLTTIPDPGRRKPGTVGKLKPTGEPLILREFGRPVRCINNKAADALVADFEFVSPRIPLPLFIPARLYLAYGIWTEADGARVLFSRDYMPLWRLRGDRRPQRLSPVEWIHYTDQEWFWEDSMAPWRDARRTEVHVQRLNQLGIRGVPRLVEILPTLVFGNRNGSLRSDVKSYFANPPQQPDRLDGFFATWPSD